MTLYENVLPACSCLDWVRCLLTHPAFSAVDSAKVLNEIQGCHGCSQQAALLLPENLLKLAVFEALGGTYSSAAVATAGLLQLHAEDDVALALAAFEGSNIFQSHDSRFPSQRPYFQEMAVSHWVPDTKDIDRDQPACPSWSEASPSPGTSKARSATTTRVTVSNGPAPARSAAAAPPVPHGTTIAISADTSEQDQSQDLHQQ